MTLDKLLEGLVNPLPEKLNVKGLSLDSRLVKKGDLFFACVGTNSDGRKFISDAIEKGCVAVVYEENGSEIECEQNSIPMFPIKNLNEKLSDIAAKFYEYPAKKLTMIGITGTNGKTSCSHFIATALSMAGHICGIVGTVGSGLVGQLQTAQLTTPNQIQLQSTLAELLSSGADSIAMEVSSIGIEQFRVQGIPFSIVIYTNLTRDHLDYHGTMENYAAAKRKLFLSPGIKHAIINIDDAFGEQLINEFNSQLNVISYSAIGNINAKVYVTHAKLDMHGITASLHTPWGDCVLHSKLLGRFNLSNLLAVLITLCVLDIPLERVLDYLAKLNGVSGRVELFGGAEKPLVIVDFAHTPDALEKLLTTLGEFCSGELWCVFGCGGDRDKGKRPEMGAIAERYADRIVVTDDNPRHENPVGIVADILQGMESPASVVVEHDRHRAIAHAIKCAHPGDIVLVAGKGHETYQEIGDKKNSFNDALTVQMILAEF
ncbi:MAG: UDP-N-acetylmuramoyl-L-alanyl-D-glutamate--2,6-diaminopimelate ligase [Gammaproteobacteria bacterium]